MTPSRRHVVGHPQAAWQVSQRRACRASGFYRSRQRYRSRRDPQVELRLRLKELAAVRVRCGYRRLHVLLRRAGWPINAQRVHRLDREEGLATRSKLPQRKRAWRHRPGRPAPAANQVRAMDFMSEQLFDGRPFRILTVIDGPTRAALATVPGVSFRGYQVVEVPDRPTARRGQPKSLRVDHGPAFAGKALGPWAYLNGIEIAFSRPGKPTDKGLIEAFNARLRAECLNASWFLSMTGARDRIEAWRCSSNEDRPHAALGHLTPTAFASQAHQAPTVA